MTGGLAEQNETAGRGDSGEGGKEENGRRGLSAGSGVLMRSYIGLPSGELRKRKNGNNDNGDGMQSGNNCQVVNVVADKGVTTTGMGLDFVQLPVLGPGCRFQPHSQGGSMMKQRAIVLTGFLAVLLALAVSSAASQSKEGEAKAKEQTVKGEVVDLWCYLDEGERGASHKECGITCAKAGSPIGILDAKGNVYVALGKKAHESDRDALISKMAETVTVTGRVVKKGGVQVVYVSSIK